MQPPRGFFVVPDGKKIPPDDRTRPPEEHEWPAVWEAIERANLAWVIVAPFAAIYRNWKALVFVVGVTLALNGTHILEFLQAYLGVMP